MAFVESLIGALFLMVVAWVVEARGSSEAVYYKVLVALILPAAALHYFVLCNYLRINKMD
jgi:hypothetical protein